MVNEVAAERGGRGRLPPSLRYESRQERGKAACRPPRSRPALLAHERLRNRRDHPERLQHTPGSKHDPGLDALPSGAALLDSPPPCPCLPVGGCPEKHPAGGAVATTGTGHIKPPDVVGGRSPYLQHLPTAMWRLCANFASRIAQPLLEAKAGATTSERGTSGAALTRRVWRRKCGYYTAAAY
jgi:hypothetical protein